LYLPTSPAGRHARSLIVRGGVDAVASALRPLSPDPFLFEVVALDQMIEVQMFPLRAAAWIGTTLGAIAVLLSVSGLYGVLAYTWNQRTRAIGIRIALGATAGRVTRLAVQLALSRAAAG